MPNILKVQPSNLYSFAINARSNAQANRELETAKQLLPAISATGFAFFAKYLFGSARVAVKSKKALLHVLRLFGNQVARSAIIRTATQTAVKSAVGAVLGTVVNPWIGVAFLALTAVDVFNTLAEVRDERRAYDALLAQASEMDSAALMFGESYVNARVWEILTLAAALPARQALALCSRISFKFNDGDAVKEVNLEDPEDIQDFLFSWVTLEKVNKKVARLVSLTSDLNMTQTWSSIFVQTTILFFTMMSGTKLVAMLSSTRKAVLLAVTGVYGHYAVCAPDVEGFFADVSEGPSYAINWDAVYRAYETSKDAARAIDKYTAPYLRGKAEEFRRLQGLGDWTGNSVSSEQNAALNEFMRQDTLLVLSDANSQGARDIIDEMASGSRLSADSTASLKEAVLDSLGGELPPSPFVSEGEVTFEEEYGSQN